MRQPNVVLRRIPVFDESMQPIKVGLSDGATPVRMPQTRMPPARRKSAPGLNVRGYPTS